MVAHVEVDGHVVALGEVYGVNVIASTIYMLAAVTAAVAIKKIV